MKLKKQRSKTEATKAKDTLKTDNDNKSDDTFKPLDEFLKKRAKEEVPVSIKLARITGINIHLPILGLLKIMSLGFLLAIMFFNLYLNRDSVIFDLLESLFHIKNIIGTLYFYCFVYILIGVIIAMVYNFISYPPFKIFKKEIITKSNLKVLYSIFLVLLFIFFHLYFLITRTDTGLILFLIFSLLFPVLFGVVGILINSRIFVGVSIIAIICLTIIDQNSLEGIINLIIFSVLVLTYFEITDSTLKYESVYSELVPDRDEDDYLMFNHTITNYLIFISVLVGLTALITFLIFYSQTLLKPLIPEVLAKSVEFNSPMFLILLLFLLAIMVIFGRRLMANGLWKIYNRKKYE